MKLVRSSGEISIRCIFTAKILSHVIPSEELSELQVPIVTIEREDLHVCSVNTDNYTGGYQAAGLLAEHDCDILIHVNTSSSPVNPAYGRIQGFLDFCAEKKLKHELIIKDLGNTFETFKEHLGGIAEQLAEKYPAQKKGIFFSSDTQANIFLNILIRKHGMLPEDILIVGFDNSPVSREAIIPISTVEIGRAHV